MISWRSPTRQWEGIWMKAERIRQLASNERLARHAGFWWGLAEGLFFFIVPDVYVSFAALFSLRAGAMAWVFSIAGSLVAVTVVYLIMAFLGLDYLVFVDRIPGIPESMISGVNNMLSIDGLPYTPLLVLTGVPLKLFSATAFSLGMPLASVLLWTLFARVVRIAPTYIVTAMVRLTLGRWIDTHVAAWLAFFVIAWFAFYVFYFVAVAAI